MVNKLVSEAEVKKAFKLRGIFGDVVASTIMALIGLNRVNKRYARISHLTGRDFTAAILKDFNISFDINEKELENIPQDGPFIVVSNHPYGAVDGIIMLHVFSSVRPEIKSVSNFILLQIPNINEFFLPVNPFSDNPNLASSFTGLRAAMESLKNGGSLALFPAGEVSTTYGTSVIRDKEWSLTMIKLIKKANVPVVPVYFHGSNSNFFHWIGKIHPMLRTARLPGELFNKQNKCIKMSIGRAVSQSEIAEFTNLEDLGMSLRARCYAMEANIPQGSSMPTLVKTLPIALPKNRRAMQKEINALSADKHLFTTGHYSCYLTDSKSIPLMMHELGRRREEAFRAVGEGTGKPLDLDEYDDFYKHLILWDRQKTRLVGAYRLGFGNEIMKHQGVKGFYTQTLFNYEKPFYKILSKSLELGRSFVVLDYQKEALPLVLLMKGLFYSVINNTDINYLLGPVSISSWYPKFYRSLMIYYLKKQHSAGDLERYVTPKNPFFPDYLKATPEHLLMNKMDSIEKFDRFMLRLSNNEYRLPTLVKKYLKVNCKIVTYNVDPDFNYCVDGLVLLNLKEVSKQEILTLAKGEPDIERVKARFGFTDDDGQGTGS
jgi:putative hemolysin